MKLRPFQMGFILICLAIAVFVSGCGAPAGNQNTAANTNGVSNKSSANTSATSNESMKAESATCTSKDDEQIERQIRILIEEDPLLKPHNQTINVDSKYCNVKLQGYVDTWEKFKKLYDKVYNADGVKKVDISRFNVQAAPKPEAQCPSGLKKCGQLCIPEEDDCTIPGETKNANTAASPTP